MPIVEVPHIHRPRLPKIPGKLTGLGIAIAVFVVIAAIGGGCASQAPVDEVGLYYTGGPIQGRHFKKIIDPGSGSTLLGIGDDVKWLPVGQRNYIVSKKETEGDREGNDFIRVPAKGGVNMDFEVSVYFKLNTATKNIKGYKGGTLRKFYENLCKKYECDSDSGWDRMLNDNFRKIIESSMRQKVFTYTVEELYANAEGESSGREDAILKIQEEIASALKDNISRTLGGEYFCGPTFDRTQGDECPPFQFIINSAEPTDEAVRTSFAAQRVAANRIITAQNEARAKQAEAEGVAAQQNALRGNLSPEYLELQRIEALKACANNQNCTLIVGGDGSGVNLNIPSRNP